MATAKKCLVGHRGCACKLSCCTLDPVRAEEIAREARTGTNWASTNPVVPGCTCGMRPPKECYRHGVTRGSGIAR